jgi:hypothetical protein
MKYFSLYKGFKTLLPMVGLSFLVACEDYLNIPPPTNSITSESVFLSKGTIDKYMTGMYITFAEQHNYVYPAAMEIFSDNAYNPTAVGYSPEYTGELLADNNFARIQWADAYRSILKANLMLEGLPTATVIDDDTRNAYLGAAYTVRAAGHYYLVRTFGDVPVITTSVVTETASLPRVPAAEAWALVIADLEEATALLPPTGTGEKRYIDNKYIPLALSARVYTTMGNWAKAEAAADEVINKGGYSLEPEVVDIFWRGSNEIISAAGNTWNFGQEYEDWTNLSEYYYPYLAFLETSAMALSEDLLNSFEPGDKRRSEFVFFSNEGEYENPDNRYFCQKYLPSAVAVEGKAQDYVFLRLAEMYLIRAEARARQNNLGGAAADLDMIRNRAGLDNTTAATQTDLINAILHERRVELFYEGGARWDDLVRTGTADAVISALPWKTEWDAYKTLWPIPYEQIKLNDALLQNPGYE